MNKFKIAETDSFVKKISTFEFKKIYRKIYDYVYPLLRSNPYYGANIKKLKGSYEGIYRYRIGDFRMFYKIENDQVLVIIIDIIKRKDAYKS